MAAPHVPFTCWVLSISYNVQAFPSFWELLSIKINDLGLIISSFISVRWREIHVFLIILIITWDWERLQHGNYFDYWLQSFYYTSLLQSLKLNPETSAEFLLVLFQKTDHLPQHIQTLLLSIYYRTHCHTDCGTGLNYEKIYFASSTGISHTFSMPKRITRRKKKCRPICYA